MSRYSASSNFRYSGNLPLSEPKVFSEHQNYLAIILILFAVLYNAILAALASSGISIGYSTVAAVEILILLLCLLLCLSSGLSKRDILPIALVWFIGIGAIIVSIIHETLYITGVRNFIIIATFSMLGQRMNEGFVRRAFTITTAITLAVLVWEMISVESYAKFFYPAHYFAVTRGNEPNEFDTSGLSAGTIVFDGRFSLGIFSGRRTSSIFLEQVGINAYAIVCMAFLNGFWRKLNYKERALQLFTIALIVLSNNARMAALMCIIMPIGYFIFPKLNRFLIILMPVAIITAIFLLAPWIKDARGDDLVGRLSITYRLLEVLTASDLIFGNMIFANRAFDSGYTFVITSVGLFGGIAYLLYFVFFPRFDSLDQRRGAWSAAVYIMLWLIVGGTGSFSIKTAALLWVLIGGLSYVDNGHLPQRSRSGRGGAEVNKPAIST